MQLYCVYRTIKMEKSATTLAKHYTVLGNAQKDFRNANLYNLIASYVQGKVVVDVGSGSGVFSSLLSKQGKEVIGIEPNNELRTLAHMLNPDSNLFSGVAEDITTFITTSVDTVVMIDVLEHVADDKAQIKKINTVLAQNGEVVLVVPAHPFLYGKRDERMGHYRRYSKSNLVTLLEESGFSIRSVRHWNVLGVLPYLISEKVLSKPLEVKAREAGEVGVVGRVIRWCLYEWFRHVENTFNFGCGLSLIIVAKKV